MRLHDNFEPGLVSVIVPAFNAGQFIETCLWSVLAQTYAHFEVIVVDDGSTDDTVMRVRDMMGRDARIRLLRQRNQGVGAARNYGISESSGEFVAPLDADDSWAPEKLTQQIAVMQEGGSDLGLVYCWDTKINAEGGFVRFGKREYLEGDVARALVLYNFMGNASAPLFRRAALVKVGGYLTREEQGGAQGCEDWDLALRIAEQYRVGLAPEHLINYRQLPESMSVNARGMARSFEVFVEGARRRNSSFPPCLFRWSAGNFYRYLYYRCFFRDKYALCLAYLLEATVRDPVIWINVRTWRVLGVSIVRGLFGRNLRRRPAPPTSGEAHTNLPVPPATPFGQRWFTRLQERRWAFAAKTSRHHATTPEWVRSEPQRIPLPEET